MKRSSDPTRRSVLRGTAGAMLGLPWLESLSGTAHAGTSAARHFVVVRNGNGVAQSDQFDLIQEPDAFWPRSTGSLTRSALEGDADRALSVLAPYADRLLALRGLNYGFAPLTCGHASGGAQVLTASEPLLSETTGRAAASGESVDNYIARHFTHNGGAPLTLYTGPRGGHLEEVLSYRGPEDLRAGEDDPWTAYLRMVGGEHLDPLLNERRLSVNDLVREEMEALLRADLSASDRQRLELHFDSVRTYENLACRLTSDEEQAWASLQGQGTLNDNRLVFARLHMDLIVLAFACDHTKAATLQIGDGIDGTRYRVGGQRLPSFHHISHRLYSDGTTGDPVSGAYEFHKSLDRTFLETFRYLLDRLEENGLLDQTLAVWCNDLANGPSHGHNNVPFLVCGAEDQLQTGQFLDLGGVTHNQVLNTFITAMGLEGGGGGPKTDFGDPRLTAGTLPILR